MENKEWPHISKMDDQRNKLRPKRGFLAINLWRTVALASVCLVLLLALFVGFLAIKVFSGTTTTIIIRATVQPTNQVATPIATTQSSTQIAATSTSVPALTPTSPNVTIGQQLCFADASTNWNGWSGTTDWKIFNGMLINDGTNSSYQFPPTMVAPCQLDTIADYAVETKVQMIRGNSCLDMTIRGNAIGTDWNGYKAQVGCNGAITLISNNGDTLTQASFDPGTKWHIYRFEAKGTSLKFYIDSGLVVSTTDNRYLTGSQVGVKSYVTQLNISYYKVTAL